MSHTMGGKHYKKFFFHKSIVFLEDMKILMQKSNHIQNYLFYVDQVCKHM